MRPFSAWSNVDFAAQNPLYNAKEPRLRRSSFSLCWMRAPHALRLLYIRSPLAYAYAELNAHGSRYARSLSFARKGVLRTSQDRQIELSLSLDFLRFAQSKRATAYAAALLLSTGLCFAHSPIYLYSPLTYAYVELLLHSVCDIILNPYYANSHLTQSHSPHSKLIQVQRHFF